MNPKIAPSIDDLRDLYKTRVPRMFYDYCETGSYSTRAFQENTTAFEKYRLRQRVAVNISDRKLNTTMAGIPTALPIGLAPIGSGGMQWGDGEILACRAAQNAGLPYILSTMSICSMEEVAAHVEKPFWFQLYVMRDRGFVTSMVQRAKAAKCSALVLTLDLQILGQRHKDVKNGLSSPPKLTVPNILNMMTKPSWCMSMLGTKNRSFGNIVGHAKDVTDIASLNEWANKQFDQTLDWSSIEFIRKQWDGKLVLKGINDVADARIAATLGVDAIIVSNHGGRQLDGGVAPIDMLGPIVDAVGDKVEVHFDSGIRSGIDVLKALALGARGVYVGRAYVYGLGAGGEAGVKRAIDILRSELDITMALCGETDVMKVGRHNLVMPVPTHQLPVDEAPVAHKALAALRLSLPQPALQPLKTNATAKPRRAKR